MNFAEQLTYWYLRLNGFVPLTNFVLHHDADRNANPWTSDADLIAIRFPHVSEVIGGQADDWDEQFERWNLRLTTETIGLIVEVKSGRLRPKHLRDFKAPSWRVPYAIRRLGMFTEQEAQGVASALSDQSVARQGGFTVAKLLVGTTDPKLPQWLYLDLENAVEFICRRMKKYANRKGSDRMFFDGDLIQFLAWRGGRSL